MSAAERWPHLSTILAALRRYAAFGHASRPVGVDALRSAADTISEMSAHIDAQEAQIRELDSDLAAALERAEKAEARSVWPRDAILSITGGPPDWSADQIVCMVEHFADEAGRVIAMEAERDAALERERMALWALALERMDPRAAPHGWDPWDGDTWGWDDAPDDQRVTVERMTRDTGPEPRPMMWVVYVDSHARHRGDTALAAILSIDPAAKPPEGWTP